MTQTPSFNLSDIAAKFASARCTTMSEAAPTQAVRVIGGGVGVVEPEGAAIDSVPACVCARCGDLGFFRLSGRGMTFLRRAFHDLSKSLILLEDRAV